MQWPEIRESYPSQWLVIEALKAYTTSSQKREFEELAFVAQCSDGQVAMDTYRKLHRQFPVREFYFVHTSRENLDIKVRQWLGVRAGHGFAS